MYRHFRFVVSLFVVAAIAAAPAGMKADEEINDTKTPLHLLRPSYDTPYGELSSAQVREVLDRIFNYIDSVTPAVVYDKDGKEITDYKKIKSGAYLNQGTFRLGSYEWGVTYQALLDASEKLGDGKYKDYVVERLRVLSESAPYFRKLLEKGETEAQMRQIAMPLNLDDAGAMGSAVARAQIAAPELNLGEIIDRYSDILENKTYRLADGTIARTRPHHNAVWLDDMYMAIPALVNLSKYRNDPRYLDMAADQALKFIDRMWVPEKNLFRHGYVEGLSEQPTFHWGRANGWAILTMSQLLDALPETHPARDKILSTFKKHVKGLAALQSKEGFWHQLLDRSDSYLETSATAIYTYCIAHAINEGWIEGITYGPVAHLGWEAVATKVTPKGEVEGTCVGTGMGFDPAFYYYRPVSAKAAHGYGPAIWAAAEMIRLLDSTYPRSNDSAIHYYRVDPENTDPLFFLDENGKAKSVIH